MVRKNSVRFFGGREVRAVWDDTTSKWWFSVVDIVAALGGYDDYLKARNYWKYLKTKLKKEGSELVSSTNQLKLTAPDGKKYISDMLDETGVIALAKEFPGKKANKFLEWFAYSEDTIDGKSKQKAYTLWASSFAGSIEVGTVKGLQQIHAYLFGGLYDFAGQIRKLNISKGGFTFAPVKFLDESLSSIESMPENTLEEILKKYVEMNIVHPFMEGNGRSMRLWLDMILKKRLRVCVDWSQIDKRAYLSAMSKSVSDSSDIIALISAALTDKINDREMFLKGIDYSYYYEESD